MESKKEEKKVGEETQIAVVAHPVPEAKYMKAVLYTALGEFSYSANTVKVPVPLSGQVLIRVECAPLNPSDIYFLQGNYSGTYEYPLVPGGEGSGTVIQNGGGLYGWSLVGKRVSFTRAAERGGKFSMGGSYGEYCVTNAFQCIQLDATTSIEQGASGFVNPLTAIALAEKSKQYGAKAVVQTGAASQLGRMLIQIFSEGGDYASIPLINIVRREEQVKLLKDKYKQQYVLNSESEGFEQQLKDLTAKLGANVALDAVAGPLAGIVCNALAKNGVYISYGQLSEQKISGISPFTMLGRNVRVEGFLLPYWLKEKSYWGVLSAMKQSKRLLEDVQINKSYGLHQIKEAIEEYKKNMTAGKILLRPAFTQ
jgi:NADPH2:quinone reductase